MFPESKQNTPAAAGEFSLSRFLAAGLALATLTPPPPSQEHPASIRGVQEPAHPSLDPDASSVLPPPPDFAPTHQHRNSDLAKSR